MPTLILGQPEATAFQLRNYLHKTNPTAPDYSQWYIALGNKYGIRGDIAFCQSILETGYWRFGGDVQPDQHNYAGLGATGGTRGVTFPTPEAGIEAQMQHLFAYATTLPLPANTVQLDPRFQLVTRGSATTWESLSGHWASDPQYGQKILSLYNDLITTQHALSPPLASTTTTTGQSTPTHPNPTPSTPPVSTPPTSATPPIPPAGTTTGGSKTTTEGTTTTAGGATTTGGATPTTSIHVPLPSDTPPDSWFTPYVQEMLDLGIMSGTGNNQFQPNAPTTRAELAAALYNLYKTLQQVTPPK